MSLKILSTLLLTTSLLTTVAWAEDTKEKAPMPQTRGMQGMDPAAHERWAKEGEQDPYKDCTPNATKAEQQENHPMPDTKGMKGMDPKAHTVDCPEPKVQKSQKPRHQHKATPNS